MQKVEGKCAACEGDGLRERVGSDWDEETHPITNFTHCKGTGMEPGIEVSAHTGEVIPEG